MPQSDPPRLEALSDVVFAFAATLLDDRVTVFLNSALLFVLLFYVYPVKFMARGIVSMIPGWMYALLGPLCWMHGRRFGVPRADVA